MQLAGPIFEKMKTIWHTEEKRKFLVRFVRLFRAILAGIAITLFTVLLSVAILAVTTGIPVPFAGWRRGIDVAIKSPLIVLVMYMIGAGLWVPVVAVGTLAGVAYDFYKKRRNDNEA